MDGRGGCCIARYAAGGAYHRMSKEDRIILRFRPIAPKPAADGRSASGANTTPQNTEVPVRTGRWKRRYVKDNKNSNSNSNKRSSSGGSSSGGGKKGKSQSPEENESSGKVVSGGETVVTLPLLSESPERKDSVDGVKKSEKYAPIWLSFGVNQGNNDNNNNNNINGQLQLQGYGGGVGMDRSVMMFPQPQPVRVVGSWVRVESVTDAWAEGYGLGRTDEEKLVNLERDSCPGFISDGLNRVRWANKAYKDMVGDGSEGQVIAWLVMKEDVRLPENETTAAFTVRVRVVRCGKEKSSLILLGDVWRMDGGGFAWRLDTKAALSLGR